MSLDPSQNKEDRNFFNCTENGGGVFTAGSWEKDTIFGPNWKFLGPSYFVAALVLATLIKGAPQKLL